jgi:hypothetical protein
MLKALDIYKIRTIFAFSFIQNKFFPIKKNDCQTKIKRLMKKV